MSWLIKMLVGDVPGDCRLEAWDLQLRGNEWFPWWAAVLVALVAFGLILLLYFRETARVTLARRLVGAGLRTAAVVFILLLLMRPVLVTQLHCEKPRDVVLLIDNSLSMTLRDQRLSPRDQNRVAVAQDRLAPDADVNGPATPSTSGEPVSRGELVQAVLTNPRLRLVERLGDKGPLRAVLFGAQPHPVADETPSEEQKTADPAKLRQRLIDLLDPKQNPNALAETQTALADVLAAVLQPRHGEDLPAAVVVVTDGRDNASRSTLDQAAQDCALAGVPLYVYGVGSSESGNLMLKEVAVAETLFSEDTASVAVRWRSQGFSHGRAEITVTLDGQVVARKEVPVKEGDDFREVLTFTTPKVGVVEKKLDLNATVKFLGQEAFTDDNNSTQSVRVMDRKVRVLYIEGQPRWEYKFLMQNLLRDRRVQARLLPIQGDPRALQSGVPYLPAFPATREELFSFDLIILGDVPANFFSTEQMEWVRDFVQEGGGLVTIAGPLNAPQSWIGKPLAEVLPVEFSTEPKPPVDPNARTVAFHPVLTPEGKRREMLWLADTAEDNVKTWKELPGFYWYFPVTRLRAGAEALLTHPTAKAGNDPMPLAAWHFYGKGRVLYLGTDEVWRWRYNSGEKHIARFWGQVVYQMGMPHLVGNPKRVQLNLEKTEAVVGQPMTAYVRLLDAQFRPMTTDKVSARVERLDAKPGEAAVETVQLAAVPGQPGEYRVVLDNGKVGRFALKTDSPEPASLEYRVALPTHHELAVAGMAEEALRQLAEDSGGKFYREEDLKRLPDEVQPQTSPGEHRREVLIWQAWWVMLLFLGIVTAEWLLRKFSNLS